MYDVIVVGARCAGSPTAMLLAQKGYRVLLADKASFPSDTISTHMMHHVAGVYLKRWNLLDRLLAAGTPPCKGATFYVDGMAFPAPPTEPVGGVEASYSPRRTVLDTLLVEGAVE